MNWRTHAVSLVVLIFSIGAIKLVWDNPKIILYLVLSVIALLAYGAIYIVVKSRFESRRE